MVTQSEKDYNGGWKINEENDENVNMSEPASMAQGSQSASTPVPGASADRGTLPRPKNMPLACFLNGLSSPTIYDTKKRTPRWGVRFLVPLTGLEPVQYRYRGILSPLCLPISPQRRGYQL